MTSMEFAVSKYWNIRKSSYICMDCFVYTDVKSEYSFGQSKFYETEFNYSSKFMFFFNIEETLFG